MAWNKTSDLVSLPNATLTLLQGSRTRWSASTSQLRALENPTQTQRRAASYWDDIDVKVRLDLAATFAGTLHLYVLDWDSTARRETVTVDCGSGPATLTLTTSFGQGAWLHFPVSVAAGGSCQITVHRTAGANAVVSGIFLGN
jgi:hypothetical protein